MRATIRRDSEPGWRNPSPLQAAFNPHHFERGDEDTAHHPRTGHLLSAGTIPQPSPVGTVAKGQSLSGLESPACLSFVRFSARAAVAGLAAGNVRLP